MGASHFAVHAFLLLPRFFVRILPVLQTAPTVE